MKKKKEGKTVKEKRRQGKDRKKKKDGKEVKK